MLYTRRAGSRLRLETVKTERATVWLYAMLSSPWQIVHNSSRHVEFLLVSITSIDLARERILHLQQLSHKAYHPPVLPVRI